MSRNVVHGIVKEVIHSSARLVNVDITNDYSLSLHCVDVNAFDAGQDKNKNYSAINNVSDKGVYIFFDDEKVLYVGKSGSGNNGTLQHRVRQHIVDNPQSSPVMKHYYYECNNAYCSQYSSKLWEGTNFESVRKQFKDDYFHDFLCSYSLLIISVNQISQSPQKDYDYVISRLESALIAVLNPVVNA